MQLNFLQVSRKDFVREAKAFRRRGMKMGLHTYFSMEGGNLQIECGSVRVSLPAQGQWQGVARTSWSVTRSVIAVPPSNDPIPISYAENTLMIGNMSIHCSWLPRDQPSLEEIDKPSLLDLIALDRLLSREEAQLRGIAAWLGRARVQYRQRLAAAVKQLEPLGVSETELRLLVESKIEANAVKRPSSSG